ncbi:MAG: WYL domain-containing transcriptional regulator [Myxococcales bacterium]|nr:WYL domain-containing transcriptional regulator [Myxococcales bacterium]MCB9672468.1 WYL domain-containing transcriptional regulator [Alphaproteobacteria bacterium]MCB9692850.1 WYL domain-containing transcriptional regulator [Alphaproteobacteria bacterium]
MNKAQKLVRMVEWMGSPGGVRVSTLMDKLELDARTLRRYLEDIRDLGLPVSDGGRGQRRVLSMDPVWRRTGVQLTLSEVLSLHFGRTLFDFLKGTQFAADLNGALERLQPAISQAHQDLASQLDQRFLAVPEPRKVYTPTINEHIDAIVTSLIYDNPMQTTYRKASGVAKNYTLEPYTLATFRQGLYLFARDVRANQVKTFAVERFTDVVRQRARRFEVPAGWTPHAHIAHAFGIISGPPAAVTIAFRERVMAYVRERTWHPTQTFGTRPDGRLELRMYVAVTVELEQWVLGFGADAEVIEPEPFRERIAEELRAASAWYA